MGCARAIIAKLKSRAAALKNNDIRPLLDMCPGERREINLYNSIQGFAYASAVPGAVESTVDALNTAHIISSVGAAAKFIPVSSLLGLNAVGIAAGIHFARKQVAEEKEKIIRLNKELFILFNIAADRYEEYQRLRALTVPGNELRIADANKKYRDAVLSIQKAILSDSVDTADVLLDRSPSAKQGETKSTPLNEDKEKSTPSSTPKFIILSHAVRSYVDRRKLPSGLDEIKLWTKLKTEKNIFRGDEKPLKDFIDYSSAKQIKKFFDNKNKNEAKAYQKKRAELESMTSEIKNTSEIKAELQALRSILDVICSPDAAYDSVKGNISHANSACDAIMLQLPAARQAKFQEIWIDLRSAIINRNDLLLHCYDETSRQIANDTAKIFGEQGSFREFWRGPDRQQSYADEECISHNLEQMIHRGGAKLEAKAVAEKSILTTASLYSTGQGLYFAAVALGAAAISSTVVGLIVAAIAISLAILCIACYMRTQKTQRDRDALVTRFQIERTVLVRDEIENSQRATQNRDIPDDAAVLHREEKVSLAPVRSPRARSAAA